MNKFWYLFLCMFLVTSAYSLEMIADISDDVETEFGTYHPYLVDVTPACTSYTIDSAFTNVSNFTDFTFTACEESLLFNNVFVATPSNRREIYDIYNEARENETPIFVSCDALLHTYHLLYDKILQTIEVDKLVEDIKNLTDTLYSKINEEWTSVDTPTVKEALRLDLAYFSVAKCLLDTTFNPLPEVDSLVNAELSLIEDHIGYGQSPIFGYAEDYSQYVPRGHYTKSDTLMLYFKCMMWYGRMTFAIDTLYTRMAVLLVHAIHNVDIGGESGVSVWERIYLPTVFFVGKSDDIHLYQYTEIMEDVYGVNFASLPPDSFANDVLLGEFIEKADSLPDPAIPTLSPKGFRFMGQRFIPDSYILSELTHPRIPGLRGLPKGLDVLSVLGSDRAYEILDQVYDETDYEGYPEKMDSLKVYFDELPDETWAQNLYWNWLYCLMPFTVAKWDGYPTFMQNTAWVDKELYCALGSWTELRHDTILYAKQSVSWGGSEPPIIHGYVEPNPWFFARLASLSKYMRIGLAELDLLYSDFEPRLLGLENLLLVLKTIAEKELTNQTLTYGEKRAITGIGAEIATLVTFDWDYTSHRYEGPTEDDQMPVVADVHTDILGTGCCLEEGVGYPFNLYVIVPINGELKVTWGAGFSYYEFLQPLSDRLTDEAWQEMLQTNPPEPPVWIVSFIDTSQLGPIPNPEHYDCYNIWNIQNFVEIEEEEESAKHKLKSAKLSAYPNPFSSITSILCWSNSHPASNIQIYDLSGRLVKTTKGNTIGKNLKSGIYFLKVEGYKPVKVIKLR